jgi:hypothetical protein
MNSSERGSNAAKHWLIGIIGIVIGASIVAASFASSPTKGTNVARPDPGSLVSVQTKSQVGVLLDEIPQSDRDRAAADLISNPDNFWTERAKDQIRLMTYRLVFRDAFYDESEGKSALPLPPEEVWNIHFEKRPFRGSVDGHDLVLRNFTFKSTLLTEIESPAKSEPNLQTIGGQWEELFILPIDPELIFQRTGFACMDEDQFPPDSVDAEEVDNFYDQDMEQSSPGHYSETPEMSCVEALDSRVGKIETSLVFERLPWNSGLADKVRVGQITNPTGPDLIVEGSIFKTNRLVYRYITPDSCAIDEGSVGGAGWRRLLQFSAGDRNFGANALEIGDIDYFIEGNGTELSKQGIYEYSICHHHYHFKHYGSFTFGDEPANHKMGFCLQSTNRLSNNEFSPLQNRFSGCSFQGIEVGWVDEYEAGLEGQWVDVTGVDTSKSPAERQLSFHSNPDDFLCEGIPVLDAEGDPVYEPTEFKTDDDQTVYRAKCDFGKGTRENNMESYNVTLPIDGNGYVTEECKHGEIGPLRNCGFQKVNHVIVYNCTPEEQVRLDLTIPSEAAPQVVRVCEYSSALATSIPCTYNGPYNGKSLANGVVVSGDSSRPLTFVCPPALDHNEHGGNFSLYFAPLLEDDSLAPVNVKIN